MQNKDPFFSEKPPVNNPSNSLKNEKQDLKGDNNNLNSSLGYFQNLNFLNLSNIALNFANESNKKSNKNLGPDFTFKTTKKNLNTNSNTNKSNKDVVSVTYEEIGLWPRSFSRVLDRFLKQVFSDVENLVIQEYRFYRYLFLTTVRCLCILFFVPFLVNFFAKNYLIHPLTEYFWNTKQSEIFLNSYQQKHAFAELKEFEEKLYFESFIPSHSTFGISKNIDNGVQELIKTDRIPNNTVQTLALINESTKVASTNLENTKLNDTDYYNLDSLSYKSENIQVTDKSLALPLLNLDNGQFVKPNIITSENKLLPSTSTSSSLSISNPAISTSQGFFVKGVSYTIDNTLYKQKLQEKTIEIATHYNEESIEAITNFFADLLSFLTLIYLLFNLEIQINITKSFLLEVFFGLDDSKKSLLILLVTDLLVGYHSSNLWELFFEFIFHHYGLPESQTGIFLLVATLPVLLDVLFKYLIFRHLNRSSPATVATYHAMIE